MIKLEKFEGNAVVADARIMLKPGVETIALTAGEIYTVEHVYTAYINGENLRVALEGIADSAFDPSIFDLCVEVKEEENIVVEASKPIDFITDLGNMVELSSILLPMYDKNLILGGSASLFLQYYTDALPHDLDFILYSPTQAQSVYLDVLAIIFADINKHIDYHISKDHYVVKIKVDNKIVDIIVYKNETINATDFNSIGVGNLGFQLQSLENVVKAKLVSARPKDYKQLAHIFKIMSKKQSK